MFEGNQRTFIIQAWLEIRKNPKILFQGQERAGEGV